MKAKCQPVTPWLVIAGFLLFASIGKGAADLSLLRGPVRVGPYHPHTASGITWVVADRLGYDLTVGFVDQGKLLMEYRQLDASWRPLAAATDSSYYSMEWKVATATVRLSWATQPDGSVAGILETDRKIQVALLARPAWKDFPSVTYRCEAAGVVGATPGSDPGWRLRPFGTAVRQAVAGNADEFVASLLTNSPSASQPIAGTWAGQLFTLMPTVPLRFAAGLGNASVAKMDAAAVDARLAEARCRYDATTPKDPDLEAIQVVMNTSRLYSPVLKTLAHTVSRGWCLGDEIRLFCWDSFFNGLLAAYVDLDTARDTVRAILSAATPEGYIPNVASDRSQGRPFDRSQLPVGAMAVWRMHEQAPDRAFLAEVYPKLAKWHDWWFAFNAATGKPNRDGNQNGLLEWGCANGQAQSMKFESFDDSPMWDEIETDPVSKTMRLDAVDLNALWAMDAEYLAKMAETLGRTAEAQRFRQEVVTMNRRINDFLWDEEAGLYANRYWAPRLESFRVPPEVIPPTCWTTPAGARGVQIEYFKNEKFDRAQAVETMIVPDLSRHRQRELAKQYGDERGNLGIRWTGTLKPAQGGLYALSADSRGPFRISVNGEIILEQKGSSMPPSLRTQPLPLKADQNYSIKVECFERDNEGACVVWHRMPEPVPAPRILSGRFGIASFFPLCSGAPDAARAHRLLQAFKDKKQFQGEYVVPTISRADPAFPRQDYWRGKIWGPSNYLIWLGLQRYANPALLADVAAKSEKLFMRNWQTGRSCHENFLCNGSGSSDPHYTWGALLALINYESRGQREAASTRGEQFK